MVECTVEVHGHERNCMAVTIKKIAELAGVSRGTVDRALNHRGGVNAEVAERIREIAQSLGYTPNLVAKSMAIRNRQHTIGVILCSQGNDFYQQVLEGIEAAQQEVRDFGFSLDIREIEGYDVERQLAVIDELMADSVHALVVTPINDPAIRDRLDRIRQDIPVIAVNVDIEGDHNIPYIGCDYYKSGQTAGIMMNLLMQGKGRILIVTGSRKVLGHNQRVQGFTDVLGSQSQNMMIADVIENEDSNTLSYHCISEYLRRDETLDGVYFAAGGVNGGVRAILDAGQEQQLTLVTNDVTPERIGHLQDGVIDATICQQPYEQGYNSIKKLFDSIIQNKPLTQEKMYTDIGIKLKYNI